VRWAGTERAATAGTGAAGTAAEATATAVAAATAAAAPCLQAEGDNQQKPVQKPHGE